MQSRVIVAAVVKGGAAEGVLHAGDVIKAVDGTAVTQADQVAKLVTRHKPGQPVVFTVVPRQGRQEGGGAATAAGDDRHPAVRTTAGPSVRSSASRPGIEHLFPFTIDIKLADVGGPSAGMMFALGIIDKLTPGQTSPAASSSPAPAPSTTTATSARSAASA